MHLNCLCFEVVINSSFSHLITISHNTAIIQYYFPLFYFNENEFIMGSLLGFSHAALCRTQRSKAFLLLTPCDQSSVVSICFW